MNEYLMDRIATDRRRQLEREAGEARMAAAASRPRPRSTYPKRPRGFRAQLGMILGRSPV